LEDLDVKANHFVQISLLALGLLTAAGIDSLSWAATKPVVVLQNAEPVSLDPMFTQSDANVILSIHEGLFRLDNEGKVVPAIAESIANVDPLSWDIKIRRGLTFHNGEPINADAVVFTFDRAKKLFAAGKGDLTFALGALKYDRVEKSTITPYAS
jgi:peptide/nickel transport system substrate-binding protein